MRDSCRVFKIYDLLLLEHLDPKRKSEMGLSFSQLPRCVPVQASRACMLWVKRDMQHRRAKREENGHSAVRKSG